MNFKVKAVIECMRCEATAEVLADVTEERCEGSCGCPFLNGTDRFFVDPPTQLPPGWWKKMTGYLCPKHA
jgi:hypothetical protein